MANERRLIEQPHVTEIVNDAHAKYSRFHDIYDGLTWLLCRDPLPEKAVEIAPGVLIVKTEAQKYPGFCVVTLIYTIDGDEDGELIIVEDMRVEPV